MPTVSTKSAKPTVPLLAGLLIIAVFVSTPLVATIVLARVLRSRPQDLSRAA